MPKTPVTPLENALLTILSPLFLLILLVAEEVDTRVRSKARKERAA